MGAGGSTSVRKRNASASKITYTGPRQLRVINRLNKPLPKAFGSVIVPPHIPSAIPPPPNLILPGTTPSTLFINNNNSGAASGVSKIGINGKESESERSRFAWFVEDLNNPGEWEAYISDICERLDAALRAGKTECLIVLHKHAYTVDLCKMEQRGSGELTRPRRVKRAEVEINKNGKEVREKRYVAVDPFAEEILDEIQAAAGGGDDNTMIESKDIGKDETNNNNNKIDNSTLPQLLRSVSAHLKAVFTMTFSPDGQTVLSGTQKELIQWNVETAKVVTEYNTHSGVVLSAEFSPNGSRLIYGGDDFMIRLYNTSSPEVQVIFNGHSHKVYGVGFLASEDKIATASMDQTVRSWDVNTGVCLFTSSCHTAPIFALATSKNCDWLAITGSDDNTLCSHDLRLGANSVTARFIGHTRTLWSCALRNDNQQFASSGIDNTVRVWDIRRTDGPILKICHHVKPVHMVEYLQHGKGLLSCGRDMTVRLTDLTNGEPVWRAKAHTASVFRARYHAETQMMATGGGDCMVNLWQYGNIEKW